MHKGVYYKGLCPFEQCEVHFIQMPKTKWNLKFILVLVDTFWIGRGTPHPLTPQPPLQTEKVTDITKLLLKEVIPRFGLP